MGWVWLVMGKDGEVVATFHPAEPMWHKNEQWEKNAEQLARAEYSLHALGGIMPPRFYYHDLPW